MTERKLTRSDLVPPPEPPKNPFIELKRRVNRIKRRLYVSEKERERVNTKAVDPVKKRARNMVAAAIARGELVPRPCSWVDTDEKGKKHWCNETPTEAHHKSYDEGRELDVRWLCKPHHDRLSSAYWQRKHGKRKGA